jgi:hypothetical protein
LIQLLKIMTRTSCWGTVKGKLLNIYIENCNMIVRYMITCFGTTFETLTEIESLQGPTTLYGRLLLDSDSVIRQLYVITMRISEVAPTKKHCRRRWQVIMSLHNWLKTGSLKRKLNEGNFQSINVDLHIPISVTLLS